MVGFNDAHFPGSLLVFDLTDALGVGFPSPGDLPNPRIEHRSPTLQVDSLPAEP